jgi:hypothetical protein
MLRLLLILLLLANGLFWAWSQGLLAPIGLAPQPQREPQRLALQVAADKLRLLPTIEVPRSNATAPVSASAPLTPAPAAASALAASGTSCMQTPLMSGAAASAAESALANALPSKPWQRVTGATEGQPFAVAMTGLVGQALVTKQRELDRLSINHEPLATPAGSVGGLVLGRFATQAQANAALAALARQGVRTARVVTLAESSANVRLRIDPVSDDVAGILRGWNAQATEITTFRACDKS